MAARPASGQPQPPEGCEAIGKVLTVNPARREARARIGAGLELLPTMAWAWFSRGGEWMRYRVVKAVAEDGSLRLSFAAGVPMDTVRGLQGQTIAVEKVVITSRGPLWQRVREMLDLPAIQRDGSRVGTVVEVLEGPRTGVIKIESDNGTQWLVPVVPGAVEALDEVAGTVVLGDFRACAIEIEEE